MKLGCTNGKLFPHFWCTTNIDILQVRVQHDVRHLILDQTWPNPWTQLRCDKSLDTLERCSSTLGCVEVALEMTAVNLCSGIGSDSSEPLRWLCCHSSWHHWQMLPLWLFLWGGMVPSDLRMGLQWDLLGKRVHESGTLEQETRVGILLSDIPLSTNSSFIYICCHYLSFISKKINFTN